MYSGYGVQDGQALLPAFRRTVLVHAGRNPRSQKSQGTIYRSLRCWIQADLFRKRSRSPTIRTRLHGEEKIGRQRIVRVRTLQNTAQRTGRKVLGNREGFPSHSGLEEVQGGSR